MRTETFETDRRVSLFKQIDLDLDLSLIHI